METIRKTKSKIGMNDKPPYIPLQMISQTSSTRLDTENPSKFQEGMGSYKMIRVWISLEIHKNHYRKYQLRPKISSKLTQFLERISMIEDRTWIQQYVDKSYKGISWDQGSPNYKVGEDKNLKYENPSPLLTSESHCQHQ